MKRVIPIILIALAASLGVLYYAGYFDRGSSSVEPRYDNAEDIIAACGEAMGGSDVIGGIQTLRITQNWPDHGRARGYVPYAIDRMDKGWRMFPKYRGEADKPPSSYLDRFYYDTTTFTDRNLRFLVDVVGSDRVVLGSDWPAPMAVDEPVKAVRDSLLLCVEEKEAIIRGNISRALK